MFLQTYKRIGNFLATNLCILAMPRMQKRVFWQCVNTFFDRNFQSFKISAWQITTSHTSSKDHITNKTPAIFFDPEDYISRAMARTMPNLNFPTPKIQRITMFHPSGNLYRFQLQPRNRKSRHNHQVVQT